MLVKACRAPLVRWRQHTQQSANAQQSAEQRRNPLPLPASHCAAPAIPLGSVAWVTNNTHAHCPHLHPPQMGQAVASLPPEAVQPQQAAQTPLGVLTDRDLSSELPAGGLTDGVEMVEPGETACLRVILATGKAKCVCRDRGA